MSEAKKESFWKIYGLCLFYVLGCWGLFLWFGEFLFFQKDTTSLPPPDYVPPWFYRAPWYGLPVLLFWMFALILPWILVGRFFWFKNTAAVKVALVTLLFGSLVFKLSTMVLQLGLKSTISFLSQWLTLTLVSTLAMLLIGGLIMALGLWIGVFWAKKAGKKQEV